MSRSQLIAVDINKGRVINYSWNWYFLMWVRWRLCRITRVKY